jgi:hypothetical protein
MVKLKKFKAKKLTIGCTTKVTPCSNQEEVKDLKEEDSNHSNLTMNKKVTLSSSGSSSSLLKYSYSYFFTAQ